MSFSFSVYPIVQFTSVAQLCLTPCDLMNRSTRGFPVHHQLLEFAQIYVHRIGDAIQPSHPLSFPFPPALNPSQHQGFFQWVSSSHQVAKVLEFQLQHQSFQWTPRTDPIVIQYKFLSVLPKDESLGFSDPILFILLSDTVLISTEDITAVPGYELICTGRTSERIPSPQSLE